MTIVGKILTFIVLVFSLVIGYGEMVRYVTREKALDLVDRERDNRKKAEELAKATAEQNASLQNEKDSLKKQLDTAKKDPVVPSYRELALAEQNKKLQKDYDDEQEKNVQRDQVIRRADDESKRRQKDVEEIRKALADEIANSEKLINDRTEAIRARTKAELEARTANDARQRLEQQVQDLTRDVARLQAVLNPAGQQGGVPAGVGQGPGQGAGQGNARGVGMPVGFDRNVRNAPIDIEGHVLQIDERSGLLKLSVGSDSGLQPGQMLEVFRLSRVPNGSKYLGTIRVTDVGPKEAVAQPVGRMTDRLQPGDQVANRINRN
jgi:hypothetical protein